MLLMKKTALWMAAAAVGFTAMGCAPRSAKEFSGVYSGSWTGTILSITTYSDGSTTTKTETPPPSSSEVTLNALNEATIVIAQDDSSPAFTFKQNASQDTLFDIVPRTDTQEGNGYTYTNSVDSGSVRFTGLDVTISYGVTMTYREANPTGEVTSAKAIISGTFTGTKN